MEQLELFPSTGDLSKAENNSSIQPTQEPTLPTLITDSSTTSKARRRASASEQPLGQGRRLTAVGLFAGIGGIERGLSNAGHEAQLLCEIDVHAQAVLRAHFPGREISSDVRLLSGLPDVDILAAGFPCQDLSQAGRTAGIGGNKSGVVGEVFRLLKGCARKPTWLLLENVPFMLQLDQGRAMRFLTSALEELGLRWAYRVVDARAFGLPQRRQRVIFLASATEDPRPVLFGENALEPSPPDHLAVGCGFYWTEGIRGLGWAVDSVPTIKGGSTIGIPSPPAIRLPHGEGIVTPDVRDAERLQGFPADWTLPAVTEGGRKGGRWRLVGNAVNVSVSEWVGRRLNEAHAVAYESTRLPPLFGSWPSAAWGEPGRTYSVEVSRWPVARTLTSLMQFLQFPCTPLSERATAGFFERTKVSSLRFPKGFLEAVEAHLQRMIQGRRL